MVSSLKNHNGATLVEALVAGSILVLVIIIVFQIMGQGSIISQRELLQRRAFQELEKVLGDPRNQPRSYMTLPSGIQSDQTATVTLDVRGAATTGAVLVRVDSLCYTYNGMDVPYKLITAKITYSANGTSFTDSLLTAITLVDIN